MSTVPQTTDQKIDAALEPEIIVRDDGGGMHTLISIVSTFPEVHVTSSEWRDEEGSLTRVAPWTVTVPSLSQLLDAEGDFESAAAASRFGVILTQAALMAKQLEEAGR